MNHPLQIAEQQPFSKHLGFKLISAGDDRAIVELPYRSFLGDDRIHGGAISALVDTAATCAFWSDPNANAKSRGATVGFSISFLKMSPGSTLRAHATVRRRGGAICFGDVSVTDGDGDEVAIANVTYKLKINN
ncbi:MAG: PaaI family thioesterase [Pseudomonadota bacterium]